MFIEKLTIQEKENLKNLCRDYRTFQNTEAEAKKAKENTGKAIKALLENIGFNGDDFIADFHIIYKEIEKTMVDTDKLKTSGLYETFSKKQITKPLNIK